MSILIFQRILPPYRLAVFRELYRRFAARVCFSDAHASASLKSVDETPDFPTERIGRRYIGARETAALQNPLPLLRRFKPRIVVSEFAAAYLTMWVLLCLRPFFGFKLLLWTHAVDNHDIHHPFASRRGRLALWLFKRVDGIICYSRSRCEMVRSALGENAPQLFVAPNTIDTSAQHALYDEFETRGKAALRAELGMRRRFQLVYIGRLIAEKRIDLLLESFNKLSAVLDVELHVIGDGPERASVESAAARNDAIICHGAIWDERRSGAFLYAADVCLNPGYLGLSLVHCFCFGTPIVSCLSTEEGPFHSPEVDYLQPGVNGLLLASDADALAGALQQFLTDEAALSSMSAAARRTSLEEVSLDRMMDGFAEAFEAMEENSRA